MNVIFHQIYLNLTAENKGKKVSAETLRVTSASLFSAVNRLRKRVERVKQLSVHPLSLFFTFALLAKKKGKKIYPSYPHY